MIEITHLDETNLDLLDGVDPELFDEDVRLQLVKEVVKDRGHIMLLAINEGSVIGQVLGNVHKHIDKHTELYIDDLAVADNYLRQGVASLLVRGIIEIGRQRGCKQVWIVTEPDNEPANKLYESLGLTKNSVYIFDGEL
ncbi:MAG: GNAT family N-acetyltransferase [Gammaproteobacteria bacterium]|nr:GNAT family N-acetyltransferase [Gammaproteobacteria bacterium]